MESIYDIIESITPPDEAARAAAKRRWDSLAKPLGSLGLFEDMVTKLAALRGNADAHLSDRRLLVFCADHGVAARGVTQCGSEVTGEGRRRPRRGAQQREPHGRLRGLPRDPGGYGHAGLSRPPGRSEPPRPKRHRGYQPRPRHDAGRVPRRHAARGRARQGERAGRRGAPADRGDGHRQHHHRRGARLRPAGA